MIYQLTGTLVRKRPGQAVLDVSGIGFELGISIVTYGTLPAEGTPQTTLYVRMRTPDTGPVLFGFATAEERTVFDKLTSISGVGPKVALGILSSFTPMELAATVAAKDTARLTAVPGVGKKTAGRLMLELEGLFATDDELSSLAAQAPATLDLSGGTTAVPAAQAQAKDEAYQALLGLGFSSAEADLALDGAPDDGSVQALIAYGLKRLGGGR